MSRGSASHDSRDSASHDSRDSADSASADSGNSARPASRGSASRAVRAVPVVRLCQRYPCQPSNRPKTPQQRVYGAILKPCQPCQPSVMSSRSPRVDRTAANFGVLLVENPSKFGRHQSLACFCRRP